MASLRIEPPAYPRSEAGEPGDDLVIKPVSSPAEERAMIELRRLVFQDEQGIAKLSLTDPDEPRSQAVVAWQHGVPVGTGRLTFPGDRRHAYISWVATRKDLRRRGIGEAVMRYLLDVADQEDVESVVLSAQAHAISFYQKFGFVPVGSPFEVRTIPHQTMIRHRPSAQHATNGLRSS